MKSTIQLPSQDYPYLAIWTGGEPLDEKEIKPSDIVVISYKSKANCDNVLWCQSLFSNSITGFELTRESDYKPLPKGTIITITQ